MFARVLAALLGVALAGGAQSAPLEAYGRLPYIETAAISQDGTKLALILTEGETRKIAVEDLASGRRQVLNAGDTKVRDVQWAGSEHLLITMSTSQSHVLFRLTEGEWAYTFAYRLSDGKLRQLLRDNKSGGGFIAEAPEVRIIDGKPRVFVEGFQFLGRSGEITIYEVDLESVRSEAVAEGFLETIDWVVGVDGKPLAQSSYDSDRGRWTLRLKDTTHWRSIERVTAEIDRPSVLGLGRTPDTILIGEVHDGSYRLKELNVQDGVTTTFDDSSETTPVRDPATGLVVGFRDLIGDDERITFFDDELRAAWAVIQKTYPGQNARLVSWSQDKTRFVIHADSPIEGPAYALVDLKAKQARWLGATYQGLQPNDIGPVRPIAFKAGDGLDLTGYLTLPHGATPKALPLIVLPHGGPAVRDTPGFDWWAQALASRGYAVMQVNYRGSAGFGWDFLSAGFGEWGRKMQTDLSDGVRHLAAQGIVDPNRVCIVGGSYGGYAALAGATIDTGVYRCAAAVAGVADLKSMLRWERFQSNDRVLRYWTRFMGLDGPSDPDVKAISPIENIDRVTIPILLVHGRDDTVVSIQQSLDMRRALEAKGKPVEFVELRGEDHWLSRGDTRLQMLGAVVAFMERHNPPR